MPLGSFRLNSLGKRHAPAAFSRLQKVISVYGNAQISTAQSKFGGSSILLDGTGDYLKTGSYLDHAVGTGDFTLEAWVRVASTATNQVIACSRAGTGAGSPSANAMIIYNGKLAWSNGSAWQSTTSSFPTNQWVHCAVSRSSGTVKIFLNGVSEYSQTQTVDLNGNRVFSVGAFETAANYLNGYIDEVRFSNTARYTSNFTPSSTAFENDTNTLILIHADGSNGSTSIVDDAGAQTTLIASGGTIFEETISGTKYIVHKITANDTFSVLNLGNATIDFALVGGGGGSGGRYGNSGGGGGGGGAVNYISSHSLSLGNYSLTIGAGGSAGTYSPTPGGSGGTTTGFGYSVGGGGGGGGGGSTTTSIKNGVAGSNGSSGGGGGGGAGTSYSGTGGAASSPGTKGGTATTFRAGGGGGGSVAGTNGSSGSTGGTGSNLSSYFGTSVGASGYFAGGGGGGAASGYAAGLGGSGGGGNGSNSAQGVAGTANTGGGAGGGGTSTGSGSQDGMPGGSGIILIRYLSRQ